MRSVFSALTASLFAVSSKANLSDSGVGKFDLKSLDLGGALDLDKLKGFDLSGGLFGVGKKEGRGGKGLNVGLEVEEYRINGALDVPAIDFLLEEGGTFVDSTAVPLNTQYESTEDSFTIPYTIKSIEYVGSACPPQNTTGTAEGFDEPNRIQFSVNDETGPMLECPEGGKAESEKKGKEKGTGPKGDIISCFIRAILEADVGVCDGSTALFESPSVSPSLSFPDNMVPPQERDGQFVYNMAGLSAYTVNNQIEGFDHYSSLRVLNLNGDGNGNGFGLPIELTKDATNGCVDGKQEVVTYHAHMMGFQTLPQCTPGVKATVDRFAMSVNFDSPV
uniref:YHYH domain-containing protein n=1 Tax=Chromera velia CCMP2878 TaxID=1169474 RepID=A0A0G4GX68_9ALVE|eukprot:Cvel_23767.t1-p1 / transcript=Cvel_23767.t1 / gene=Cvel_23767 / organism=Chromera_velia_CCMP2878 / gene_product=hypothetical protein / transcript_product=hypothetical protein / location=Cvel_scaffold2492:4155-5153(-) / protein_length=333 / sequence_SO=supercontig / SO=protein_coding / is_pseudo=false